MALANPLESAYKQTSMSDMLALHVLFGFILGLAFGLILDSWVLPWLVDLTNAHRREQ